MTKYLLCMLAAIALCLPGTASAGSYNLDPNAQTSLSKLGGLPTIRIPRNGTGTATLAVSPEFLVSSSKIWSTSNFSPGTSLYTGVPLISNVVIGQFGPMASPTGPFYNKGGYLSSSGSIPNPVGPGMLTGLVGYGSVEGEAKIIASNLAFTLNLTKLGKFNKATTTVNLGGLAKVVATFGPWVTDTVTITSITTNYIRLPNRVPPETGIAFTIDPLTTEEIKTILNSQWTTQGGPGTMGGFHPLFSGTDGYVTDWRAWTFAQTATGLLLPGGTPTTRNGNHNGMIKVPQRILKVAHTVTFTKGGLNPTAWASSSTGVVTVVTPMRIDTSDKLTNAIPGVIRFKFSFVPEPGTLLMLVAGTVGLIYVGRARSKSD